MTKRVSIWLAVLLVAVLITGLILGGCGGKTTTTTTTTSTPQVITLKFSSPFIEQEPPGIWANHFMDLVEQNSNGRVHFERYFAESLAKHTEQIQLVSSGSVDVVNFTPSYLGQELVLNQLFDFPFYCSNEKALAATTKAYFEIPETKAIFDAEQKKLNIKILYWTCNGEMNLMSRAKVTTITELKDTKINMWAPGDVKIWGEFGMTAIPIYIADMYESLSRGVIDSVYFPPTGAFALKLFEQAKTNLTLGQGDVSTPFTFNLKKWNSLPKDIQDIIMAASLETSQFSLGGTTAGTEQAFQAFRDSGIYVGPAPQDEQIKLFEALMKYTTEEQWVNTCNAAGLGAEAQVLLKYWRDMSWGR
jgi:TRAP-type C4-dicarboxylate transport system substrate-binding protein